MNELTAELLGRACRVFLQVAYPGGPESVPPAKRPYLAVAADQPLEPLVKPPVGQALATPEGGRRGYALRLGSAHFPHLKLQAVCCGEGGAWVFAVDTHDAVQLRPDDPDAERWAQIQAANRRCKEAIERAWDEAGLLTFHGLLRRQTARPGGGAPLSKGET